MSIKIVNQVIYTAGNQKDFEQFSSLVKSIDPDLNLIHIKSAKELTKVIADDTNSLLVGPKLAKGFDIVKAITKVSTDKHLVPAIALSVDGNFDRVEALTLGLLDVVQADDQALLKLVLEREFKRFIKTAEIAVSGKDFTGLHSRLQFLEDVSKRLVIEERPTDYHGILYLQLDSFTWINESLGIEAGDSYLRHVGTIIQEEIAEHDIAARYQGGSFVIYGHADNIQQFEKFSIALKDKIAHAVLESEQHAISSTVSIGARVILNQEETLSLLINEAYEACDKAKSTGGDDVKFYQGTKDKQGNVDLHTWDLRIRRAFENDLFMLYFQPIVSLKGDTKPRYEALLRMRDEKGKLLAPGTFLPFAERAGLMSDLDRFVMTNCFKKAQEQKDQGIDTVIFVKLSGKSLIDKTMSNWIRTSLKDYDFAPESIVFEITENLAVNHLAQSRMLVNNLHQMGCRVLIDHFGTRLKSFRLLDQLEVDMIKIDGSIIRGLVNNNAHKVIVKKIVKHAQDLKLKILAESVQDAQSLPIIWEYEIEFIQGYFLQEPNENMIYDFTESLM
jgi:multidomain signaling protein FimX